MSHIQKIELVKSINYFKFLLQCRSIILFLSLFSCFINISAWPVSSVYIRPYKSMQKDLANIEWTSGKMNPERELGSKTFNDLIRIHKASLSFLPLQFQVIFSY